MQKIYLILFFTLLVNLSLAVTPPSGIGSYIPIIIQNQQAVATSNPFQQLITVNSLAYQSYEAANLMNEEFFYDNGLVIPSWIESNNTNSAIATKIWISVNAIQASSNEIIYLGWANTANDLLVGGTGAGEDAQFLAVASSNSVDNGATLFPYYQNFANIIIIGALPSGWSNIRSPLSITYTATNILIPSISATQQNGIVHTPLTPFSENTPGNVLESKMGLVAPAGGVPAGFLGLMGLGSSSSSGTDGGTGRVAFFSTVSGSYTCQIQTAGIGNVFAGCAPFINGIHIHSINYGGTWANGLIDYNSLIFNSLSAVPNPSFLQITTENVLNPMALYFVRTRVNPPNNVMPLISFNGVTVATPTPSTNTIEQTQTSAVLDTGASGGTQPYSYQWLATTAGSTTFTAAQGNILCSLPQTTTCTFVSNSLTSTGVYLFSLQATDTGNIIANSVVVNVIVNAGLSPGSITPSSPKINLGQTIILTSNPSGGTIPYTYQWYTGTSPGGAIIGGATSQTYITSPTSNTNYYVSITDNIGVNQNSLTNPVNVFAILSFTLAPTNTLLDSLQFERYTANAYNGISPAQMAIFNLTAWSRSYVPFYQNSNILVNSGSSNSILFQSPTLSQVTLPSGWNIGNYVQISLTNLQLVNTSHGFQYQLIVNGSNYTTWTTGNLQNVGFFYANGTKIPSWLEGNAIGNGANEINTNNLNLSNRIMYWLKLNPIIPNTNLVGWNQSFYNNTNQPTCDGIDGQVAYPSGIHGLYIFSGATGLTRGQVYNSTTYQYASNDPRICGILLNLAWATLEPTNNTYRFDYITNVTAPYIAAGKKVELSFYYGGNDSAVYYPNGLENTALSPKREDVPQFVLSNSITVPICSGITNTAGIAPLFWTSYPKTMYKEFISNVINHYNNNASITTLRFGTGRGDTILNPIGNSISADPSTDCGKLWVSNGLTYGVWLNYTKEMLNYEGSLHSKKQLLLDMAIWNSTKPYNLFDTIIGAVAVNNSIGLGIEGWDKSDGQFGYMNNLGCVNDWCNLFNQYQGKVPFFLQPSTSNVLDGVKGGQVNNTFNSGPYMHGQIFELWNSEYLLADDPTFSITCTPTSGAYCLANPTTILTYNDVHVNYTYTLNAAANILGRIPNATIIQSSKQLIPPKTNLIIYMGFAPKSTNLFDGIMVGEAGAISQANIGSCANDNGAQVFNYYQSFACLAALPAGWSQINLGGATITFNPTNTQIANSGPTSVFNGIYENSPASANTAGNTIDEFLQIIPPLSGAFGGNNIAPISLVPTSTTNPINSKASLIIQPFGDNSRIICKLFTNGISNGLPVCLIATSVESLVFGGTSGNYLVNYASISFNSFTSSLNPTYLQIATMNSLPISVYWLRTRYTPPNGVMPYQRFGTDIINSNSAGGLLTQSLSMTTLSYEAIAYDSGSANTVTLYNSSANTIVIHPLLEYTDPIVSNAIIDANQYQIVTANIAGGTLPYTYNYEIFNSIGLVTNALYTGLTATSNTFLYQQLNAWGAGTFTVNTYVTDSASTPVTISNTVTYTAGLNPSLTITPTNIILDSNQLIKYTISESGGIGSFTIKLYNVTGSVQQGVNVLIASPGGSNTISFFSNSPTNGNVFSFNAIATDSGTTTPVVFNSITNAITVNKIPLSTGFTASNSIIFVGNYQALTATILDGTSTYTYNFLVYNSAGLVTNMLIVGNAFAQNVFSYQQLGAYKGGTFTANIFITDSATTPIVVTNSLTYTVNTPIINFQNVSSLVGISTGNDIAFSTYYPFQIYGSSFSGTTYNVLLYNATYQDVIYSSNAILAKDLFAHNVIIDYGVYLTTNGHSIIVANTFTNNGIILTGYANNGGSGSATNTQQAGGSFLNSIGGSGGGSGIPNGANGGNTLALAGVLDSPGTDGSTPVNAPITQSNIIIWSNNGMSNFLSGAGGGGSGTCAGNPGETGGSGAFGLYIQAATVANIGTINANGIWGVSGLTTGSGAGGGGVILIASNTVVSGGTFNVLGGSGGLPGGCQQNSGAGGNGMVLKYIYATPPINTFITHNVVLFTNALSFSHIISPANSSGIYTYFVNTLSSGTWSNSIINVTVNMTSITNTFAFNSPVLQYYPNLATLPPGSFTASPSSWKLWSSPTSYTTANFQPYNAVFTSNGLSLPLKVMLQYSFTSFNISLSNNPAIQTTSISLLPFAFILSDSVPSYPYTRNILNFTVFDLKSGNLLTANTNVSTTFFINNFSFSIGNQVTANAFQAYIAQSNFNNPTVSLLNLTSTSSASGHFQAVNNWFSQTIANGTMKNLHIYLTDTSNASLYTFQIFACGGSAARNFTIELYKGTAVSTAILEQTFKIATSPFALPLLNGFTYFFRVYNRTGSLVFTSPINSWPATIQLFVPCSGGTVNPIVIPNINASCVTLPVNAVANYLHCSGSDTTSLTFAWNITIFNQSTVISQTIVNSVLISGNSFVYNYTPPTNDQTYFVKITALTNNAFDPTLSVLNYIFQLIQPKPLSNGIALVGILLFATIIASFYYNETAMVLGIDAIIVLGQIIGIYSYTVESVAIIIAISLILIWKKVSSEGVS